MNRISLMRTLGSSVALATVIGLLGSCAGEDEEPQDPDALRCLDVVGSEAATAADWEPVSTGAPVEVVELSFELTLDPSHPDLDIEPHRLDPLASPIEVGGDGQGFELVAFAKRLSQRPDTIWLELHLLAPADRGLDLANFTLAGADGRQLWDIAGDPFGDALAEPVLIGGHVAPGGRAQVVFGVEASAGEEPLSLSLSVTGDGSTSRAQNSAPLAISPDGAEVWSPFADADTLAVVDTGSDSRVAELEIPGRPSSTAITADGELVLTTSRDCNQVVVVDRSSREVVQVLGEADGIGRDPRFVVSSPDGRWAFVSSYVGDSVTALRRTEAGFRVAKTIAVDRRPATMAVSPDSRELYVAHWMPRGPVTDNEAWVDHIDIDELALVDELVLDDDANLEGAACLQQIPGFDTQAVEDLTFEGVPTQLSLFLDPSGNRGIALGLRIGPFPILEGDAEAIGLSAVLGANSPAFLFELDAREPAAPRWSPLESIHEIPDRPLEFLECVQPRTELEFTIPRPVEGSPGVQQHTGSIQYSAARPVDTTGASRFVAFAPQGRAMFMLGYAADHLIVLDQATKSSTHETFLELPGSNPIGMVLTPDGRKGYVLYENSTFLSVLDTSAYADAPLQPSYVPIWLSEGAAGGGGIVSGRVANQDVSGLAALPAIDLVGEVALVDEDPMDPVLRRGRVLFTSSNPNKYPELALTPQASCSACHPDGGTDGSGWSTVEGERRTFGLWGGTAGRGWLHASATHASSEEFATVIVVDRLGGTGLSEDDVHALSLYVAEGIPEVQRPVVDEALVAEGRELFEANCQGCHSGPKYTSGGPVEGHPYGGTDSDSSPALFNVGTATEAARMRIGTGFTRLFPPDARKLIDSLRGDRELGAADEAQATLGYTPRPDRPADQFKAPSLTNTWENSVWFHDASMASLDEVVDHFDALLGLNLDDRQHDALVEFLKTL